MAIEYRQDAVDKVLKHAKRCIQSKYPWTGKPLDLTALAWQHDFIKNVFGYWDCGQRVCNKAQLWIPRKSGKSTLLSCLSTYHLIEYPGSDVVVIATDIQQAAIIWDEAACMLEAGPYGKLEYAGKPRFHFNRQRRVITDRKYHSTLRCLSGTDKGKAGLNCNSVIWDELGDLKPETQAHDKWAQLESSTAARPNAIQYVLSTAQFTNTNHIGYKQYELAKRVMADRSLDGRMYAAIYECPNVTGNEWKDPLEWRKCNPSCDITFPFSDLQDKFKACELVPSNEYIFRTLRLNQWQSSSMSALFKMETIIKCREEFDESQFKGLPCYIGLDSSYGDSWYAYVLLFPHNGLYYILPRAFTHSGNIEHRERTDGFPYRQVAKDPNSNFYITEGNTIQTPDVIKQLVKDIQTYDVKELRADFYDFTETAHVIEYEHSVNVVKVMGTKEYMSSPLARWEKEMLDGTVRFKKNLPLEYCLQNANKKPTGPTTYLLSKPADCKRIDLAQCIGLAFGAFIADRTAGSNKVYCW